MARKREYTEDIHIDRLVAILSNNRILCNSCPAAKGYSGSHSCVELWTNDPCPICAEFVGVDYFRSIACPCIRLGDEEAYNITIQKLEEMGYTF